MSARMIGSETPAFDSATIWSSVTADAMAGARPNANSRIETRIARMMAGCATDRPAETAINPEETALRIVAAMRELLSPQDSITGKGQSAYSSCSGKLDFTGDIRRSGQRLITGTRLALSLFRFKENCDAFESTRVR